MTLFKDVGRQLGSINAHIVTLSSHPQNFKKLCYHEFGELEAIPPGQQPIILQNNQKISGLN